MKKTCVELWSAKIKRFLCCLFILSTASCSSVAVLRAVHGSGWLQGFFLLAWRRREHKNVQLIYVYVPWKTEWPYPQHTLFKSLCSLTLRTQEERLPVTFMRVSQNDGMKRDSRKLNKEKMFESSGKKHTHMITNINSSFSYWSSHLLLSLPHTVHSSSHCHTSHHITPPFNSSFWFICLSCRLFYAVGTQNLPRFCSASNLSTPPCFYRSSL